MNKKIFKYVMLRGRKPIMFPVCISHDTFKNLNPVTAGFVKVMACCDSGEVEYECYGHSESLSLPSGKKDGYYMKLAGIREDDDFAESLGGNDGFNEEAKSCG